MSIEINITDNIVEVTPTEQQVDINITETPIQVNVTDEIVLIAQTGLPGPAGPGVAVGGTAGQILAKNSATNYDTIWIDNKVGTVTSIATSFPITGGTITASGTIGITQSGIATDGYLSSADWNTFNNKQGALTLTTTGTSGAATLIGNTLNVPQYEAEGNYVTTATTITINGVTYDLSTNRSWSVGTVTSVGLTMPVAFAVGSSPITGAGTLAVTAIGTASQYIRGDGQLATLPSGSSGGSSVNYYLNGSVAASVVGYQQMSNSAIIGAGTDFALVGNGLIAQFLTDVANPNRLLIPGGAWNFEMFFNMSSGGGNAKFYVELLKYDGATFTSIASSSAIPEEITGGTTIDLYVTSLAVPETVLLTSDRLAIRVYIVDNSGGRTATLHTENNTLCEIITTFAGGISALNGLTANTQYLAVGTSGTDFAISSVTDTHTFNLPTASAANRGALSSADWTTFNAKIGGTGANGQVAYFTGTNTQSGSNNLFWDNANGRLGIGTASPLSILDISAGAIIIGQNKIDGTTDNLKISSDFNNVSGLSSIEFLTDGTEKVRITNTGNVGIGTNNPSTTRLNVLGASSDGVSTVARISKLNAAENDLAAFDIQVDPTNNIVNLISTGTNVGAMAFYRGGSEEMRINASGNIGIGTTTIGSKLQVNGNAAIGYSSSTAAPSNGLVVSGNTLLGTTTDNTIDRLQVSGSANITGNLTVDTNTLFVDSVNNRVGIGTTSPSARLQTTNGLNSSTAISILEQNQSNTVNAVALVQIKGVSGLGSASGKLEFTDGTYTGYIQGGRDGVTTNSYLAFGTTTNEYMRITSTGNVGIGTTSPANRLDVSGLIGVNTSGQTRTISTFQGSGSDGQNIFIGGGGLSSGTGGGASSNGSSNTAVGVNALLNNTTGRSNSALGVDALRFNTTGSFNTANGVEALFSNTTGGNNTAFGAQSLQASTTAIGNTGIGNASLLSNTTGALNTAIGISALRFNTTGTNNTALGFSAGRFITGGLTNNTITNNSIFIGVETKAAADNQTNQIVIGYQETGLGSNTTIIGNSSTVTTALRGRLILGSVVDNGVNQLQVTGTALFSSSVTAASLIVNTSGQARTITTFQGAGSDGQNIFIGGGGLGSTTGGGASTNGSYNTSVGVFALNAITTGYFNTANGVNALLQNTTGHSNTANGFQALQNSTAGSSNTATGVQALLANTTAANNTANGRSALQNNTTGANNTAVGGSAGRFITGGVTTNTITNNSIFIGYDTRAAANNQTNQIVIGYQETGLGSNTTIIGNSSTVTTALRGRLILGTTTDNGVNQLQVTGSATVTTSVSAESIVGTRTSTVSGTNGSLIGRDLTNTAKRIDIGYAAGINGGYISVQEAGVDWRPLFINPISSIAASVIIGKTTDDGVNKLQVVGNVLASQFRLSALNTAPATAASAGTLGEIRIDADYIYVCTATNTWKRVAIATW